MLGFEKLILGFVSASKHGLLNPRMAALSYPKNFFSTMQYNRRSYNMFTMQQYGSRPRLYREHNFVTVFLNDFSRSLFRADFSNDAQVAAVSEGLESCIGFLSNHAKHENEHIHPLLKSKGDKARAALTEVEAVHHEHAEVFSRLRAMVDTIKESRDSAERIMMGYEFKLAWGKLEADNLQHQYVEETVVMPALWMHCTDDELKEVDAQAYRQMSPDDMIGMMTALFPHMNIDDHRFFLEAIREATPNKFLAAFAGIVKVNNPITNIPMIPESELNDLLQYFKVTREQLANPSPVSAALGAQWGKRNAAPTSEDLRDGAVAAATGGARRLSPKLAADSATN